MARPEQPTAVRLAALLAGEPTEEALTAVAAELEPLSPVELTALVAELATTVGQTEHRLAETRAELAKTKRWFDTMDKQLRVLERERQKLSAVINQSDTPIFIASRDLTLQGSNAALKHRLEEGAAKRLSGLTVQEVWDALAVDCPPAGSAGCPLARAFDANLVAHAETRQFQNGSTRNLYLSVLPIKDPDGSTAEVLVMIQDLSNLEVLRRSESRYRLLFERSPDAMVMADPHSGRILLTNPAATELTGYAQRELAAMTLEELHQPADWPAAHHDYERAVAGDAVIHAEHHLLTSTGQRIDAQVTATRFDLNGRPVVLAEFQDVTEQRRLQAELHHSQKMEAVGRLAGGVAHEFNNIMTIILGQSDLLGVHPNADAELREIADTTGKAALRAAFLTRKLLAFSRKEVVCPVTLDLNEVIGAIEGMVRHLVGERATTHIELAPEACLVRADRGQIEQVVINLAANARDALRDGGNFWLAVSSFSSPGSPAEVILTARDDGMGMDAETRDRLFEPFFTTKAPGEGTGLGMSTIYNVVETCGGRIEVESEPDQGSCFVISLPRALVGTTRKNADTHGSEASLGGDERILVVDDIRNVRETAARMLELDGYDVTVAGSGEEALAIFAAATEPFHLLLTDVVMPGMTGGELAQEVTRRFPETRVLYVSGYTDEEIVRLGVSRAEADFLHKPFSSASLGRKVRAVLDS